MSRTPDPGFDVRIADWLESDPNLAPPDLMRTVEAALPSIPQRRVIHLPRRLPPMNRFALIAATVGLVALAGFGLLTVGSRLSTPPPPAVVSPVPSQVGVELGALTRTFDSDRHGYTIRYPDGWVVTPATTTWLHDTETLWGDTAMDVVQSPDARLVAASQPLKDGQTPDAWYSAYCGTAPTCGTFTASHRAIPIGTATGYVTIDGDPALGGTINPGGPIYDAVTVVDGRGYEFTLDGRVDRSTFEQLLASVAFKPADTSALDTADSRFTSPLYGYSIRVDPAWTTTTATVTADDPGATDETGSDRIHVAGTDTTIGVTADTIGAQSYGDWLAQIHQGVLDDAGVPASCKNGEPSTWPTQRVGNLAGRLMTLCNFAQVFVEHAGRAYTFTWSNDTFDDSSHLDVSAFKQLLTTVTFGPNP